MNSVNGVELVVASGNAKKLAELRAILEPLGVRTLAPADVGGPPDVEADAPDFAGNARKKATSGARASDRWCLADDSGLAVDALGGAPGVHSARFAGKHGDDAANNALLLEKLAGRDDRGAAFVCTLALARPDGTVVATFRGEVRGRILERPSGTGGFGYDPLFALDEPGHPANGRSFAEIGASEKSAVSHRGRALRELARALPELLAAAREPR
ncbi:MAG: RdgB/HAM1 family non-canonical purine NTP pyrophosphatase [Planctomycetota bacterium]